MASRHNSQPMIPATAFSADVSERGLLGAILLDGSLYREIAKVLAVRHFASQPHRVIFSCIQTLDQQGCPVGLMTVAQELDFRGQLAQVGDHAYLDFLTDGAVLEPSHVKHLAFSVRRLAKQKEVSRSLETIADASVKGETLERTHDSVVELLNSMSEVGEHLPYSQTPSGIMWKKLTRDGSTSVRLTNFQCRIVAEVTRDDGITERRVFELEAILHG